MEKKIVPISNSSAFDMTRPSAISGLIPKLIFELTKSEMEIAIIVEIKYKIKVSGTIFCKLNQMKKKQLKKKLMKRLKKEQMISKIIKK